VGVCRGGVGDAVGSLLLYDACWDFGDKIKWRYGKLLSELLPTKLSSKLLMSILFLCKGAAVGGVVQMIAVVDKV